MLSFVRNFLKILKYLGIGVLVLAGLVVLLIVNDKSDSYSGGLNLVTQEWCYYGYNPDERQCCQDDDYSCEARDRGAMAECNDQTFSFSATHSGTCSHHYGVNQWYR
ncbi:MAG: DUF3761 domain-containing protein [Patescibacteria group bacterium]